jgi:ABC-type transport system involved in multi-copper enzyme maturation permease subunit
MFITLLIVTFVIAVVVSSFVVLLFGKPIAGILRRIIVDDISNAWLKYMKFAIYVVGISTGVRVWELERYITPSRYDEKARIIELTSERWVLEVYRTIIETLQGIAWMLLVFFVFALIAYVIVRVFELRHRPQATDNRTA